MSITVDGGETNQYVDGFGVNTNYWSYTNADLNPVLDALTDEAGMTLFRVVFNNGWEETNDNDDASVMNTAYYSALYSGPEFQKLWNLLGYLEQKGMAGGIVLNFQGAGPDWMGGDTLTPGMEDEWAEMIVSLLLYARTNRHLQFNLLAPDNEPNITGEGIYVPTAAQYTSMLEKLAQKLDVYGLMDFRFVVPDRIGGSTNFFPEMMASPTVTAKVAHFGMHSYSEGGLDTSDVFSFLDNSGFMDRRLWVTEFNVWCDVCEQGASGTNDWGYFRETADYLLDHLRNGASAGIAWEGYDSYYPHHDAWSFWGLFAVDDTSAPVKTYAPRKNFYTLAQVSRFVRPGARQISLTGSGGDLWIDAFYHDALGQLTLVGINKGNTASTVSGTLVSLPAIASLYPYYTSSETNLACGGSISVTGQSFYCAVPPDCVFTICGFDAAKLSGGPTLSAGNAGGRVVLTWPLAFMNYALESAASPAPSAQWTGVTNVPGPMGQNWRLSLQPTSTPQFFRLRLQ